jgi:hypothetical protein
MGVFYFIESPIVTIDCANNPCVNGGECMQDTTMAMGAYCQCAEGYTGQVCGKLRLYMSVCIKCDYQFFQHTAT